MNNVRHRLRLNAGLRECSRGFTLIELMVTIMVLAILLGVAVPSFRDAALGSRLTAYANDIVASVQVARSEAIKRNANVLLCASEDGAECGTDAGWEVGWIVVASRQVAAADPDDPPETVFDVVLQRQPPLSSDFLVRAGAVTSISFPPTAIGVDPAPTVFTVCRASPVGKQEREVRITSSGSTSVQHTTAGACP